jgi:predicted TIM-barrel fold metal-dependent hydrolase
VVQALRDALGPLNAREEEHIFGDTARRFYRLKV